MKVTRKPEIGALPSQEALPQLIHSRVADTDVMRFHGWHNATPVYCGHRRIAWLNGLRGGRADIVGNSVGMPQLEQLDSRLEKILKIMVHAPPLNDSKTV